MNTVRPLSSSSTLAVRWSPQALRWSWLTVPVSLAVGLLVWELAVRWSQIPAFILPPPSAVAATLLARLADGSLLWHASLTLGHVLGGLALGLGVAFTLGYLIAKSPMLEAVLGPYIVASQAVPVVAIAPLLVIWLGPGPFTKMVISALIVFFPVLVNTVVGVRAIPAEQRELFRAWQATRWQTLWHLEIPAALPVLLGGLRVGATLAVIGAVVGEFVGSDRGLAALIMQGQLTYATSQIFVGVLALVLMALTLYGLVTLLEHQLLKRS